MDTLHHPPDNPPDPLPPRGTDPYFRRALDLAAEARGLPPEDWAA
jgi:hypothetical protein